MAEKRSKFLPKTRSTVNNKERAGGRGVKIVPARGHRYFAKLRSPTKFHAHAVSRPFKVNYLT